MYNKCGKIVYLVVKKVWKLCLNVVSSCLLIIGVCVDMCTKWSITLFLNINLPRLIHSGFSINTSVVCLLSPHSTKPILTTKYVRI